MLRWCRSGLAGSGGCGGCGVSFADALLFLFVGFFRLFDFGLDLINQPANLLQIHLFIHISKNQKNHKIIEPDHTSDIVSNN